MCKMLFSFLMVLFFHTPVKAVGTPLVGKQAADKLSVMSQRFISCLSPKEFSALTGQKMGFFQRIGYNKLRKRCMRELTARGLQQAYDTLYLHDGRVVPGFVLQQKGNAIVYKDMAQDGLQNVSLDHVNHIGYSRMVLADTGKVEKLPFEKTATAAMWIGLGSIASLLLPFTSGLGIVAGGIIAAVMGIIALNRIKKSEGKLRGKGRAWVGIGVGILIVVAIIGVIASLNPL